MPRSKRDKKVSLTQTDKKGREGKELLFDAIREQLDSVRYVWAFSVENMRNTYLKDVRAQWSDSRIFLGRTKVMAKALGLSPEDEYKDNLHELTPLIKGTVGLLCTQHPPELVREWFDEYRKTDFARAGTPSPITFTLPEGPVMSRGGTISAEDDVRMTHILEPTLRQLGVPTRLQNGVITLGSQHTVCNEGDILNSNQTRLLKLFGLAVADFEVRLLGYYDAEDAKTTMLEQP
ncbi:mRNA turnover and ribosome assembly protein [Savitreella phatthalungensis]